MLRLQQAAGNGAVQRMLTPQSSPATRAMPVVQRYEAGEHIEFGDVYEVKPGETVYRIATKFGVSSAQLRETNKDKLKTWPQPDGRIITGFNAFDTIVIPARSADGERPPSDDPHDVIEIKGVEFTYGELIALGDFYGSPSHIYNAPKDELEKVKELLVREAAAPGSVTTKEWTDVLGDRYVELLERNEDHFAPSDPTLIPSGGHSTADHKSAWEERHKQALDYAMDGNRDQAMVTNAFGDHFLTDAFAAGHLFNKRDLMDTFAAKLSGNEGQFLAAVAQRAWADPGLSRIVSGYELTAGGKNIGSEWMFRQLLKTGNAAQPDLLRNAVVNVVHNHLNTEGVEVSNDAGRTWTLGGDKHLDTESFEEGKRAVAQSQQNVLNILTAPKKAAPDHDALFSAVWSYVPRPTKAGTTSIRGAVLSLTDPSDPNTVEGVAMFLIDNIQDIMDGLEGEGYVRRLDDGWF